MGFSRLTSSANRFPAPSIPVKVLVYVLDELAVKIRVMCFSLPHQKKNKNS